MSICLIWFLYWLVLSVPGWYHCLVIFTRIVDFLLLVSEREVLARVNHIVVDMTDFVTRD